MAESEKEILINSCREILNERREVIKKAMDGLKEDLENETKSSAGDKFETGREMINIEWNKLSIQLKENDRLHQIFNRIDNQNSTEEVRLGSIVRTSNANYFISAPIGIITAGSEAFFAIGINSPVARLMLGLKQGEDFSFNGKTSKILKID
ncbi:transcription elongation factor [Christiangramia fulva]|uniref:Transcription elongation factor n=1 Tax=Christiangramia fulva TaxID=2126553 RepID=A0A2R3Z395_9FLAO|nr:transcription elongation factor [Christiangramia fulva]AVR44736.1 transcription elongation factor [Christiangramia fulva]